MYAITLTQPFATLCVAPLLQRVPLLRSWMPSTPQSMVAPGAPIVIEPGRPPKTNETRSFRPHAAAVGPRVVMHAGKGDAECRAGLVRDGQLREPYASAVQQCGYTALDPWGDEARSLREQWRVGTDNLRLALMNRYNGKPLPLGAAVGLVTFTAVEHTISWWTLKEQRKTDELDFLLGDWTPGRFAWHMANAVELPQPVPCRGFQMIWKTDAATDAAITVQGVR